MSAVRFVGRSFEWFVGRLVGCGRLVGRSVGSMFLSEHCTGLFSIVTSTLKVKMCKMDENSNKNIFYVNKCLTKRRGHETDTKPVTGGITQFAPPLSC